MNKQPPPDAVLITGASTGIGRACARRLDEKGVRVFAGVRKKSDGEALRGSASERLIPVLLDVMKPDTIATARRTIGDAVESHGLAGLVNNAGVFYGGPLEFVSLDEVRKQFEVNLFGAIAVTQALVGLLRVGGGRIVNISSISGLMAFPFFGPYAASKFALEAISDSWRVELRPWGIRVAVVEPGDVDTPIRDKAIATLRQAREALPPEAHTLYGPVFGMAEKMPRRGIPPERVAEAVEHALLARKPRRRYLVGRDARVVSILRRLPAWLRDRIVARQFPEYGCTESTGK